MTREVGCGPSFVDRGLGEHRKTPPQWSLFLWRNETHSRTEKCVKWEFCM